MKPIVMISVNVHGTGPEAATMSEDKLVARFAHGKYTYAIGLERLMSGLKALSLKATFFWPVYEARRCRSALERCLSDGHEIASYGHCFEDQGGLGERELDSLASAKEELQALSGTSPVGFRSPNGTLSPATLPLLESLGYRYDSSFVDDDAPYSLAGDGAPGMVELPWFEGLSDATHFSRRMTQARAFKFFEEEFAALIAVDNYASMTLHPRADIGVARESRFQQFARFIDDIRDRYDPQFLTGSQVADSVLTSTGSGKQRGATFENQGKGNP